MTTTGTVHRQQSSNAFARERDARILWLLTRHPATARMLVEIGLFRSKARASKRLRRLLFRKRLRLAGTVALNDGRPQHVYSRTRRAVKADNLLHEVQLSRVCFKTHADNIRRGPGEVDRFLSPDAELTIAGKRYFLELDCGTIGYEAVLKKRFAKYRTCRDLVLWVCPTEARMEGLRRRAEAIRSIALFTTLDLALRDPHAAIWIDFDCEKAALPRGSGGPKGENKS